MSKNESEPIKNLSVIIDQKSQKRRVIRYTRLFDNACKDIVNGSRNKASAVPQNLKQNTSSSEETNAKACSTQNALESSSGQNKKVQSDCNLPNAVSKCNMVDGTVKNKRTCIPSPVSDTVRNEQNCTSSLCPSEKITNDCVNTQNNEDTFDTRSRTSSTKSIKKKECLKTYSVREKIGMYEKLRKLKAYSPKVVGTCTNSKTTKESYRSSRTKIANEVPSLNNLPGSDTSISESEIVQDKVPENFENSSQLTPSQITSLNSVLYEIVENRSCNQYDAQKIVDKVNNVFRKNRIGFITRLYGSRYMGFSIGSSDVNIEIYTSGKTITSRFFSELDKMLKEEYPSCNVLYDEESSLKESKITFIDPCWFDLSCEIRYLGRKNRFYDTAKLLNKFCNLDDRVKILVISLRHWADVCELIEPEIGKLHPFCFTLMVIHFLQQRVPPVLPIYTQQESKLFHIENHEAVSQLWFALFKYYAQEFNWKDHVISISSKKPLLKDEKDWKNCLIGIEEPNDPSINVAKSVISMDFSQYIRTCFWNSYQYFKSPSTSVSSDIINEHNSVNSDEECAYTFSPSNFIDEKIIPFHCSECERAGHLCTDCSEDDEIKELDPLPEMDSVFLREINLALMDAFETYRLKEEDLVKRKNLVYYLKKDLKSYSYLRDIELTIIGSSANGFGFYNSDLDICLTFKNKQEKDINMKHVLQAVYIALRRNQHYDKVIQLCSAKIPLVKFYHTDFKLHGDISIYNELAIYNTELLHAYSIIDDRVKILGYIMKLMAKKACIADTAQRSLSSYSYVLMVIHFLQRIEPPVVPVLQELYDKLEDLPEKIVKNCNVWFFNNLSQLHNVWEEFGQNEMSIGELWLSLIKYYSEEFNSECVVTIRQKETIHKIEKKNSQKFFYIEDPFITTQNLAAVLSETATFKICKTLLRARKLFGTPTHLPVGYDSFKDYFFDTGNLTDGEISKIVECESCGKMGHQEEECTRFKKNFRQNFLPKRPMAKNFRKKM